MISIDSSLLAGVVGGFQDGVGLQPGATAGTPDPIIHPHGPRKWLRQGAVGSSPDPLAPIVPRPVLQQGAVAPIGAD